MPAQSWSDKRERQYEHIEESAKDSGRSTVTAKRIAAATVNKTRAEKGETAGGRSKSTKRTKKSTAAKTAKSAKTTKRTNARERKG